jgi:6-phosphogluconolactonase/glucosamine-6-phosphate isomerase/deaminase
MRDLRDERQAIKNLLESWPVEVFMSEASARPDEPRDVVLDEVARCDIFLLVIGERYGALVERDRVEGSVFDGTVSATHGEFLKARELRKPILVFVKEPAERDEQAQRFLDDTSGFFRSTHQAEFQDVASLVSNVGEALSNLLTRLVRNSYVSPWRAEPNLLLVEDRFQVGDACARILGHAIQSGKGQSIGLFAGRSADVMFDSFFRLYDAESMSNLSSTQFFSATEHFGIDKTSKFSYWNWFKESFFDRAFYRWGITIPDENRRLVPGTIMSDSLASFLRAYDQELARNVVEVQFIGAAPNGQIACVDPNYGGMTVNQLLDMGTSLVQFSSKTANYLIPPPPLDQDLTIGLKHLFGRTRNKRLVVPTFGPEKVELVRRMVLGPIGADFPASIVGSFQPSKDLLLIVDKAAAGGLPHDLDQHVKRVTLDEWIRLSWG